MNAGYLKRKVNGVEKRFYPITHIDAIATEDGSSVREQLSELDSRIQNIEENGAGGSAAEAEDSKKLGGQLPSYYATADHEHTAEDVGALPIEGGTLDGYIQVNDGLGRFNANDTEAYIVSLDEKDNTSSTRMLVVSNHNGQSDVKNSVILRDRAGVSTYADYIIYGTHNKPTASDVGAVPVSRTINGKALSADITLSATDVGARPDTWMPTASEIGAVGADHTHSGYASSADPVFTGSLSRGRLDGKAIGTGSFAWGNYVVASGEYSFASNWSHATGKYSHSEGDATRAYGQSSHAEGEGSYARYLACHAEGSHTETGGDCCHAEGFWTHAMAYQHAQGHYNNKSVATAGTSNGSGSGTAFVIGNGTPQSNSNAFRVDYKGVPYSKSALTTTGCDYAEFFEWLDGNPDAEDRRGHFVTMDGEKIKIAEPDDYILGIVSGHPSVIGNGDEDWMGRYIMDDFGDYIYEDFEFEVQETDEVTGEVAKVTKTGKRYKMNPDYDESKGYTQRSERPEWDAIGMLGVLSVIDDGTCQVNGFCAIAEGGTATASETGYRVIKRVNDHIVKVVFK